MDIFNKIENFSYKIARKIGKGDTEDEIELYEYSVFMIFSNGFTALLGLLLSVLLGYWKEYILCWLTYVSLRTVAGGQHCDSFKKCFFISNLIIILCCLLCFAMKDNAVLLLILSNIFFINTIPFCPKPSENSPSRGYEEDIKFRRKLSFRFTILLLISSVLLYYNCNIYSSAISSAILVLCFDMSNFGEKLINKLSNLFK